MRNGVLCAAVEANNSRGYRSNSACLAMTYTELPRKSKSVSGRSGKIRHHNSTDSCKNDGSRTDLLQAIHPATAPANILGSPRFL
ncbi:hypothetical protein WR25_05778 [Diploscapter pachys]|uniref:Uncharacterized protein n=1 Tax=Diploscapter pachys TaxID=2018661 RepID=A0A2A2K0J0_9BILA|nr:hypothetical protein WR25_05778 [Diploscapter pachys]